MADDPQPHEVVTDSMIEGLWAAIQDEQAETHQANQSIFRFAAVFADYFLELDGVNVPPRDWAEQKFFRNYTLRFIGTMPFTHKERMFVLTELYKRLTLQIERQLLEM